MTLDSPTRRKIELVRAIRGGGQKNPDVHLLNVGVCNQRFTTQQNCRADFIIRAARLRREYLFCRINITPTEIRG